MFNKKKAKTRSLKQWTRPHRSRMKWRLDKFFESPLAFLKIALVIIGVLYFAGFAVAVSLDETTFNPIKMVQLVGGLMGSNEEKPEETPAETDPSESSEVPEESTAEEKTEAPVTEAPSTEAPGTEAPSTEAPSTQAQSPSESTSESTVPSSSAAETTKAPETSVQAKDPSLATIFVDADIPVKVRTEAQIPIDDKTANIIAEVDAKAELQVKILGDAGESNGYKWSKIELVEDLKASEYVKTKDSKTLKKGTVCYVCTRYLKKNQ